MSDCEPHRDREREGKKLALATDKSLDWLQQLQSVYMYVCTYIYVCECVGVSIFFALLSFCCISEMLSFCSRFSSVCVSAAASSCAVLGLFYSSSLFLSFPPCCLFLSALCLLLCCCLINATLKN